MSRFLAIPALLLVAASASAQPAALPPDLALVPPDGLGFVHVRVADLWGHESLKDVRDIVRKAGDKALAALDQRFAGLPANVERITVWAGPTSIKNDIASDYLFVVRLAKPADPAALRKLLVPDAKERKGKLHPWLSDAIGAALLIADDRTFAVGSRSGIARIADGGPWKDTNLADGLAAAAGNRPLTVSLQPALLPAGWLKEVRDFFPGDMRPLLAAQTVTAAYDLAGEGHLHVRLRYSTDAAAADVAKMLKAPDGPARKALKEARTELEELVLDTKSFGLIEIPKAAAATLGLGVLNQAEEVLTGDRLRLDGPVIAASVEMPSGSKTILVPAAFAAGATVGGFATQWRHMALARQSNDLKQIILALHNYHDTFNKADLAIKDADGKPLLSWRVAFLPYIEQDNLYKQFKLDEPWDSENNKKLIDKMPKIYEIEGVAKKPGETHYRTFMGEKAVWAFDRPLNIGQIPDGSSNTVVFVQAAEPTIWTKPDELVADGKAAIKSRILFRDGRTLVGMGDGSVQIVTDELDENIWKLLVDPADGQPLPAGIFKR
jgi:hypothetical protein